MCDTHGLIQAHTHTHTHTAAEFGECNGLLLSPHGMYLENGQAMLRICTTCNSQLAKHKIPAWAIANDNYFGPDLPEALASLTWAELQLISLHRMIVQIKFNGYGDEPADMQQRSLASHVISFPNLTDQVCSSLPLDVDELVDCMKIVFVGKSRPTVDALRWVCEVDRTRVRNALAWLIDHHKDYRDFDLNTLPFDKLLDSQVPEDLYNSVTVTTEDTFDTKGLGDNDDDDDDRSANAHRFPRQTASVAVGPDAGHFNDEAQKVAGLRKAVTTVPFRDDDPVNTWSNPSWWTKSYVTLYLLGVGGPENDVVKDDFGDVDEAASTIRRTELTLEKYVERVACLRDQRFNMDRSFFGSAWDIMRRRELFTSTRIQLKLPRHNEELLKAVNSLTAAGVKEALDDFDAATDDYDSLPEPVRELLKYLRNVGSNLRQSDQERINWRFEVQSLMLEKGPFQGWITLVPSDHQSPIMFHLLGLELDLTAEMPCLRNANFRRQLVAKHPSIVSEFFHTFIDAFIKTILVWDDTTQEPGSLDGGETLGGIFGQADAFFGTIEEQKRRRLHLHLLVWFRGVPNLRILEQRLADDPEWRREVFTFVESVMTQGFMDLNLPPFQPAKDAAPAVPEPPITPDPTVAHKKSWQDEFGRSIAKGLESAAPTCPVPGHSHTLHVASKDWAETPSFVNLLAKGADADEGDWAAFIDDLLVDNYQTVATTQPHYCSNANGCFKYCKPTETPLCRGGYGTNGQKDLESASTFDPASKTITYRRTHINVNNNNLVIGACCRCNHDVKIVLSGSHCRSLAWYISSYAVKTQLSTHSSYELIAATLGKLEIGATIHSMPDNNIEDTLKRTRKLAASLMSAFQSRIELGLPLIMLHILRHPNHVRSHDFFKMNFYLFRKYVDRQFRSQDSVNHGSDDSEDESEGEEDDAGDSYNIRFGTYGSNQVYCQFLDYFFRPEPHVGLGPRGYFMGWERVVKKQASSKDPAVFHPLHPLHATHVMVARARKTIINIGCHNFPREGHQPELHAKMAMTYLHPWPVPPAYDHAQHQIDPLKYMLEVVNNDDFLVGPEFRQDDETWVQALNRHTLAEHGVGSIESQRILLNNEVLHEGIEMRQKERNAKKASGTSNLDNDHQGHSHPDDNQSDPTRLDYDQVNEIAWRLYFVQHQSQHNRVDDLDGLIHRLKRDNLYKVSAKDVRALKVDASRHSTWTAETATVERAKDVKVFKKSLRNMGDVERLRRFNEPGLVSGQDLAETVRSHQCKNRGSRCPLKTLNALQQTAVDGLSVRIPSHAIVEHFADCEHKRGLDADQRLFYLIHANTLVQELEDYIRERTTRSTKKRSISRLNVLCLGPSGCGKSSAIGAFKKLAAWCGVSHWVMTTAKTGKAAANVDGDTIDKLLRKTYAKDGGDNDKKRDVKKIQETFRHVRFLFVDEVSMINYHDIGQLSYFAGLGKCMSCTTSTKCAGTKCDAEDAHFGGRVHTTWAGDFGQLPTVKGKPLYYPLSSKSTSEHAKTGAVIYNHLTHVVLLHGTHRYRKDHLWGAFMSDLHERACTQAHVDYLNERSLKKLKLNAKQAQDVALNLYGVTSRHKSKHALNLTYSRTYALSTGHRRLAILARDKASDLKFIPHGARFEISSHHDSPDVKNLPGVIILAPGESGWYKENLCTIFKAYNGSPCSVIDVVLHPDEPTGWDTDPTLPPHVLEYMPLALKLKFPECVRPKQSPDDDPTIVLVTPVTRSFNFTCRSSLHYGDLFKITRTQFAFSPGPWSTDYSFQGQTCAKLIMDLLAKDKRKIGLNVYVMLGRVQSHSGVYILEMVRLDQLTEPLDENYRTAMTHYRTRDLQTRQQCERLFLAYFPSYRKAIGHHFVEYYPADRPEPLNFHELLRERYTHKHTQSRVHTHTFHTHSETYTHTGNYLKWHQKNLTPGETKTKAPIWTTTTRPTLTWIHSSHLLYYPLC
jgi:hypothetical protein